MAVETYSELLGRVIANIMSLEYLLQVYLYKVGDGHHDYFPQGKSLDHYGIGDIVPLNALSCYDSLAKLIERYNIRVEPELQVSLIIVELRDAIAHGRTASSDLAANMPVVKTLTPTGLVPGGGSATHKSALDYFIRRL